MSKEPVRIAVVGAGNFGKLHARVLSQLANANLVAIVDQDLNRAKAVADEIGGGAAFPSLQELHKHQPVEGVVIATRADSHLPLAREALSLGMGVLVEKPFANSALEIREFIDQTRSRQLPVMVNHLCLFHSLIAPLIEKLDQTGFRALHFVRNRPNAIGRHYPEDHPIQLTMVHDLYVAARLVKGETPVFFQALDSRNREGRTDLSWVTLRWQDGRTATFHCHMGLPDGVHAEGWDHLEVVGYDFYSKVTTNPAPWVWADNERSHRPVTLEISEIHGEPVGMLAASLRAFLRACRGQEVPHGCRPEDALQIQEWIDQLLLSSRNLS